MFLLGCFLVRESIAGFFAVLPFLIIYHIFLIRKRKSNSNGTDGKSAIPHITAAYVFCFYLVGVLDITGISNMINYTSPIFRYAININLIPFQDVSHLYQQYISNMILFIPLGFLLPVLWKRFEKIKPTFILGLLFSFTIEAAQVLTHRATDIDDIIMNTSGTIIGYFLFILIKKISPKITEVFNDNDAVYLGWEVNLYFIFTWLAVIFIQTFISSWLLKTFVFPYNPTNYGVVDIIT